MQNIDNINIGDEINVVIRGRIIEKGAEMVAIDLMELYQQNRTQTPVIIYMPINEIRSAATMPPPSDIHPTPPEKPDTL